MEQTWTAEEIEEFIQFMDLYLPPPLAEWQKDVVRKVLSAGPDAVMTLNAPR